MADIAILVAEEYERRIKKSTKTVAAENGQVHTVKWVSWISQNVKSKLSQENPLIPKWVSEPKSPMGLAASNGFFSA